MANISVTYTFTNGSTADADEVNQNFTDIINGTSDGTKDFSINALTLASTLTANGAVNLGNATSDDITITGRIASDIDPKTAGANTLGDATQTWRALYLDNTTTDGGAIYFDAGSTEFLKSDASGATLTMGGFTAFSAPRIDEATSGEGVEIEGITDGSNPTTGYVGEVITASTGRASAVSLSTGTTANITSLSHSAGRWLVTGIAGFDVAGGTTVTAIDAALSKTSATLPAASTLGVPTDGELWLEQGFGGATIGDWDMHIVLGPYLWNISATDTLYLVANATFGVSTVAAYGSISSVRI